MAFGIEKSLVYSIFFILQWTLLADAMTGNTKYILQYNFLPHVAGWNICCKVNL